MISVKMSNIKVAMSGNDVLRYLQVSKWYANVWLIFMVYSLFPTFTMDTRA